MTKKSESFPIDYNVLNSFIRRNKAIWQSDSINRDGSILINLSMVRMQIPWILPKILHAKGLQEKTGLKIIALTWNENEELTSFFNSFGIEHLALNSVCIKNLNGIVKALCKTTKFVISNSKGEDIKSIRVGNISIGKNLYEDILRTSSLSTLKSCRNKVAIKKIVHLLWAYYSLEKLIKNRSVKYAITDDMAYHEGMFIKLFINNEIDVRACSNVALKRVTLDKQGEVIRHGWDDPKEIENYIKTLSDEDIKWVDSFLEERFQGKNGRDIDKQAFVGKNVLSKSDLVDLYGIDSSKKTIVIMAHTFTDAVFNYGDYYFRDYYDWTEKTLEIASYNSNVNWILKPHPTRSSYNENTDSIESLFEKYKTENMFILGDDISSESIKNIADAIITIGGNAGAEYSCFGIPAIVVGKPYYSGHGYTIEPKTYEEYKEILERADSIDMLSEEQINKAKKVFLYKNKRSDENREYKDEFSTLINNLYKEMRDKMALQYFKDNEGTEKYNTMSLEEITKYCSISNIKAVEYYEKI